MSSDLLEQIPLTDRIRRLVLNYDPTKAQATENTIEKFKGKERPLLNTLVKKYGAEPALTPDDIKKYNLAPAGAAAAASTLPPPPIPPPPQQQQQQGEAQDKTLDSIPFDDRIRRLLKHYDPTKMQATENTIEKFKGKEKALLATLVKKYGEEPPLTDGEKITSKSIPAADSTLPPPGPAIPNVIVPPAATTTASPTTSTPQNNTTTTNTSILPPPVAISSPPTISLQPTSTPTNATTTNTTTTTAPTAPVSPPQPPPPVEKQITLDDMPWIDRITRYVSTYEKDKLPTIAQSLVEYKGKESTLLASLKSKHGDEPTITPEEIEKIKNPPAFPLIAKDEEEERKKFEAEDEAERQKQQDEFASTKPKEPNPYLEAFEIEHRPPSPKPISLEERVRRMAVHYDPKNVPAIETALSKSKGKEQELLNALINQYGPEPDYSRSIVSTDEDSLMLAPVPDDPPKSFGETYARILRIVEVNDQDQLYNLPITLEAFRGKEDILLRALIQKYGAEPPQHTDHTILENEEAAARMTNYGGDTSRSKTSATFGGDGKDGSALYNSDLGTKYRLNPPPPPPNYSGFARMTDGRLTQQSTKGMFQPPTSPPPSSSATAGKYPTGMAASATATTPPQQPSIVNSSADDTWTPPQPNVNEQTFQPPVRDEALEKSTTAKFHGWGRAVDKPVCEKLYYAPSVFKFYGKAVPPSPALRTQKSVTIFGDLSNSAPIETDEERKKRLEEQRKTRPLPPAARLLASEQGMFSSATPVAKMTDVDADLVTNGIISQTSKLIEKLVKDEEPPIRIEMQKEYDDYVEKMWKKLQTGKEKALKKLDQRMAGHIQTIHERYAFKPETLTYSAAENMEHSPNHLYFDDYERIKRKEAGFEDDLFDDDDALSDASSVNNRGSAAAAARRRAGSPLEKISDSELLLSDRENFLLAVLPDETKTTRPQQKWRPPTGSTGDILRPAPSWQFRARLARFVRRYIPTALDDVDAVAADHVGKEESLMAFLRAKYGAEPGALDSDFVARSDVPQSAQVAGLASEVQPVARSLEELDDYVFTPNDRLGEARKNNLSTFKRNPNFVYQGLPPDAPPTLDEELEELRQHAYRNNPLGGHNHNDPWDPATALAYNQIMDRAEDRQKRGLNHRLGLENEDETNLDPRLKELRSLMQAVEASSNALLFEDPSWMGEENLPNQFWDIIEHREADEDDDLLNGRGGMLHERLQEAEKLGIPKEEFMRIEKERAERRRKERERAAQELHAARDRMRELEKLHLAAQEEARNANKQLEMAKIEADEKVAAANRRIEETRAQVAKELKALDERNKKNEDESVRRDRDRVDEVGFQKKLAEDRLREKENLLSEREKEVQLRLHEANEREDARLKAEEERRNREREEIEHWKEKAQKRIAPTTSDGCQTDPIVEKKKQLVDSEVQMSHSPTGESCTQTRPDIVVIDDEKDLRQIFEIRSQTDPSTSLIDAIRETSPNRNNNNSDNGDRTSPNRKRNGGVDAGTGFNETAETGTQGGFQPEMRTRDVQTPDFAAEIMKHRLRLAETEYQEQVQRSALQLQAYETSPRFLPRSALSLQRERQQLQQQYQPPAAATSSGSSILNRLTNNNNNNLPVTRNTSTAPTRGSSEPAINNSSITSRSSNNNVAPNESTNNNMRNLNSTFSFPTNGQNSLPEPSPEPQIPRNKIVAMTNNNNNRLVPNNNSTDNNNNSASQRNVPSTPTTQQQQQQQQETAPGARNQQQRAFVAPESQTVEEYQDRVRALYKKYAPEKTPSAIDIILNRYSGEERTLLTSLTLKYGPEPSGEEAKKLISQIRQEEADRAAKQRFLKQQSQQQMNNNNNNNNSTRDDPSFMSPIVHNNNNQNNNNNNNNASYALPNASSVAASYQNPSIARVPPPPPSPPPDTDLYLEPVDFQDFFKKWELAPALLPATSSNATPRLAACKLTPEDIFLFPSLEPSNARRAIKKQVTTLNQIEQQTNGRSLYSEPAVNALQDVASRVFYFSQVMYWAPPRNPSWKYVAVTGREVLIGDDENHVKHRICLIGSPSETVALSVILYQGPGAEEGDDSPCVLVIRTGTPPMSRVWTSDVDPSSNNSNNSSSQQQQQQQQDIMLFFPSGLQARKSSEQNNNRFANSVNGTSGGGARLPVQGRFAALRAQRLMCAIEFAIQSEGPVAGNTSRGSLVTAPVTNWILQRKGDDLEGTADGHRHRHPRQADQPPPGVDETAFLLERAARDLCGVRYSTGFNGNNNFSNNNNNNAVGGPPRQSVSDDYHNQHSSSALRPAYLDKMPLAQAHYNKKHGFANANDIDRGSENNNNNSRNQSNNNTPVRNNNPLNNNNNNHSNAYNDFLNSNSRDGNANGFTPEQLQRLREMDQRANMYASEKDARNTNNNSALLSARNLSNNNNNNPNPLDVTGPPSKQLSRWGQSPSSPGYRNSSSSPPTRSAVSGRPIDPHTQNILGILRGGAGRNATPPGAANKMKWIADSK